MQSVASDQAHVHDACIHCARKNCLIAGTDVVQSWRVGDEAEYLPVDFRHSACQPCAKGMQLLRIGSRLGLRVSRTVLWSSQALQSSKHRFARLESTDEPLPGDNAIVNCERGIHKQMETLLVEGCKVYAHLTSTKVTDLSYETSKCNRTHTRPEGMIARIGLEGSFEIVAIHQYGCLLVSSKGDSFGF